jgi:TRAP-type C4-dicarboxylate transport system permease small subunit
MAAPEVPPMRAALDTLYGACGVLAALFLVLIAVLILALSVGRLFGVVVPSANELAGFSMAAMTFLALAYTLRAGGHVRVSLVVQRLPAAVHRYVELWCLAMATLLIGYFAASAVQLAYESYDFGDVSPGLLPIPLWIPQSGMALGLIVMCIAFGDEFVRVMRGDAPTYAGAEGAAAAVE